MDYVGSCTEYSLGKLVLLEGAMFANHICELGEFFLLVTDSNLVILVHLALFISGKYY